MDRMSFRNELIHALRKLERQLGSLNQVSVRLRVDRAGLKRFIDGERGLTSRTLERILDGMGAHIAYGDRGHQGNSPPAVYEKHVAQVLKETAQVLGKTAEGIAGKGYGGTIAPDVVDAMLDGTSSMSMYDLHRTCTAIGVSPTEVLQRAAELASQDHPSGRNHPAENDTNQILSSKYASRHDKSFSHPRSNKDQKE